MIDTERQDKFSELRTRLAPSPSGFFHLGNLFVAVFNMLFSLKYNSRIVLRIEDTDSSKNNAYSSASINEALSKFGILVDESAVNPAAFGPYLQSNRSHIYKFYADTLIAAGKAFYCRCSFRRINALKRVNLALGDAAVYDGRCIRHNLKRGKLRLKVPRAGCFCCNECSIRWSNIEMQTFWNKSNFSFHIANVVDDHLMRISHVLRGRDWIPNLAKHILFYTYFGFAIPKFIHLPLYALVNVQSCRRETAKQDLLVLLILEFYLRLF
ncbi:MAG: glutamate--tRNA ligase family protein [Candidatus Hodgkinia cicadicola]